MMNISRFSTGIKNKAGKSESDQVPEYYISLVNKSGSKKMDMRKKPITQRNNSGQFKSVAKKPLPNFCINLAELSK